MISGLKTANARGIQKQKHMTCENCKVCLYLTEKTQEIK